MAATVTSAWAKPGAWALDSEQHEDELNQPPPAPTPAPPTSDFPDLMTAAATKTKKKKAQTLSLGQFVSSSSNQTYQTPKGLTAEDLLNLPTGPRQRTAEELAGTRLGGGFRSYGDRNNESSNSRWGSGRGSGGGDEEGRRSSREPLGPSRADEIDDWGAMKKSTVGGGFDRRERGGGGGFGDGSHSRADDSDSWASNKTYRPTEGRKFGGFEKERRMGFESSGDADNSEKGEDWKEIDEKLEAMKMKELGSGDRFKRGGGKPRSVEDLSEKSWRKNQAVDADVAPPSGENNENGGHTEESEAKPEEDAQK
ncbi:putative plant specific eukaryotic initiation factor 4B [Helianthus debilis subsp. tardiflorus]